jgi:two-component system, cell cycle response regulator DivK
VGKTILIIDDNEEERDVFASFLRFVGGTVLEAGNGAEGIELARRESPSLIVLDLSMPVMNGWEAIRRLKEDIRTSGIPVIALTAHHLPPARLETAGFCAYLEKPIVPFRVLERVEGCIGVLNGVEENGSAAKS